MNVYYGNNNFEDVAGPDGFVLGKKGFFAAKRDVDEITVKGRNGILTIDNNRWEDVDGYYQCFVQTGYGDVKHDIELWLSESNGGYAQLDDTNDPAIYRMAKFDGPIDEKKVLHDDIARFDIHFSCMPQRFLKEGLEPIVLTVPGYVENPTSYDALPIIEIDNNGVVMTSWELWVSNSAYEREIDFHEIGGATVTKVTLDSQIENAVDQNGTAINQMIYRDYPILWGRGMQGQGLEKTYIRWRGLANGAKVTIYPRWWTL